MPGLAHSRDALAAEKACADGRAGAGERQEGDRDMRALDRERERGAQLIAVERAVAGPAFPARALARPGRGSGIVARIDLSHDRLPPIAVAAGAEIFAGVAAEEAAEAEAFVGERTARSGLPSPAAIESPMPAISTSRTAISVTTLLGGAVRQRDIDAGVVGLP